MFRFTLASLIVYAGLSIAFYFHRSDALFWAKVGALLSATTGVAVLVRETRGKGSDEK